MRLSNRRGESIDPVPFVVVAGLASMILLSFGPLYGRAFGLSLSVALFVSIALSAAATGLAVYWQVWQATPLREAPIEMRIQRLFYGAAAFAVIFVALNLALVL